MVSSRVSNQIFLSIEKIKYMEKKLFLKVF